MDKEAVRQMVRRVVYRTLGMPQSSRPVTVRPLVTETDVRDVPTGGRLSVPQGALITPLARQIALERRVTLEKSGTTPPLTPVSAPRSDPSRPGQQTVAIGADHSGYELKETLKGHLSELGYAVVDCGTDSTASVDYPDFAFAVARLVAQGRAWRGIVVDGAGIGSCMAANKVPGVRAAMCYDQATAVNSREHNDANVLTLGAGLIGPSLAQQIVKSWLETPTGGGRHARRVNMIMQIERRFLKDSAGE
jgi:ribose 5-phosphate isomerase B